MRSRATSATPAAGRRRAQATASRPDAGRLKGRPLRAQTASLWPDEDLPPRLLAGVDEAGRGPLAGPVVAAAVMLDVLQPIAGLNDSKVLTARARERLHDAVMAQALCVGVGIASVEEIDRLNILQATMLAMQRAVARLRLAPQAVWIDGNRCPELRWPVRAVVGGDACIPAISAASIVAKVVRDRLCDELEQQHPGYGFAQHRGYATAEHLEQLQRLGPCPAHRRSFAPVRQALGLAPDCPAPEDATLRAWTPQAPTLPGLDLESD